MQAESRAWEIVLAYVEKRLADGTSQAGDHLPPERVLATELGVARSSVREAIRVLEVMGLVRTQSGSGPRSGAILLPRPAGGIELLMRLHLAAHGFAVPDVVRMRILLETAVVDDLARRSNRIDLAHAAALLDAMDEPQPRESFLTSDAEFHLALADASGNTVIAATMTGLRTSIATSDMTTSRPAAKEPRCHYSIHFRDLPALHMKCEL